MAKETQTQPGLCATHGRVQATREIPELGFPFIVYAVLRVIARRKPYRCPQCAAAVATD